MLYFNALMLSRQNQREFLDVLQGISSHNAHVYTLSSTLVKCEALTQWIKVSSYSRVIKRLPHGKRTGFVQAYQWQYPE